VNGPPTGRGAPCASPVGRGDPCANGAGRAAGAPNAAHSEHRTVGSDYYSRQVIFDVPLDELRRRRSSKWHTKAPDVLPLWVAEMDVRLAEPIRTALATLIDLGDTGYPTWTGVAEAYAEFAAHRWSHSVDPDNVFVVPDVMQGFFEVLLVATEPGAKIIINPPVYQPYFVTIPHARRELVEVPLRRDDAGIYRLDLDRLEAAYAAGAHVHLLCSPHNPVGRAWTRAELMALAQLADRYGVLMLVDEVHAPLIYTPHEHVPFTSLDAQAAVDAITVTSISKGWNVPALKCAVAVASSPNGRRLLEAMGTKVNEAVSLLGAVATTAAYRESRQWLDELIQELQQTRDRLGELLPEYVPQVRWRPADHQATYLAWLDCTAFGLDDPAELFEQRGRVAFEPGPKYGTGGNGFVRFNFATSTGILQEAVRRMARALDGR
jgi:cystathionine beta-lyase